MRRVDAARCDRTTRRAALALTGVLLAAAMASAAIAQGPPASPSLSDDFREASRRALPCVVTVRASSLPVASRTAPGGSGVVIDADRGLVLTNDHVVEDASQYGGPIVVELPDARVRTAVDVRRDPRSDLALLAIDPTGLRLSAIEWGDSEAIEVGDWVLAVGQPFGLSGTVTAGIVGGIGRTVSLEPHRDLIQTDAAINAGSSGGALIDLDGRLVGINVAVQTIGGGHEGVGFAVPSRRARRVAEDLAEHGRVHRVAIGVRVAAVDPELAANLEPPGAVRVESVTSGGPAGRAGLAAGDLIVSVGGRAVASPDQLVSAVEFARANEPLALDVRRDDRSERLEVLPEPLIPDGTGTLGPIASVASPAIVPDEPGPTPESPAVAIRLPEPTTSRDPTRFPILGLRLEESSAGLAERFGFPPEASGVVIVGVLPGGAADLGGLTPGMVVTDVFDRRIGSLADFREAVATAPPDRDVILRILHRGRAEFRVILRDGRPRPGDPTDSDGA